MSRIEKNQLVMEEVKEMKGELMDAAKRKPRRGWRTWVSLIVLFVLVVLIGMALWTVAATGLVTIPVISKLAYQTPSPTYVVREGIPFETLLQQQIAAETVRRAYAGDAAASNEFFISIPENTLTTELRDHLETSGQTFADQDGAQIVVLGESGIELFLPLRDNAQETALVVRLTLSVTEGMLRATAEDVRLGSWQMGSWLREGLINPALDGMLDASMRQIEGTASITSVRADNGSI